MLRVFSSDKPWYGIAGAILMLQAGCGCVFGKTDTNAVKDDIATHATDSSTAISSGKPRLASVASKWQDHAASTLALSNDTVEAFGVFTAGGWSNQGQVIVLLNASHSQGRLLAVPPNKQSVATDRALTAEELRVIVPELAKFSALKDVVDDVFDGPEVEFVHWTKDAKAGVAVKTRRLLRKAGEQPTPDHDAVAKAFLNLQE